MSTQWSLRHERRLRGLRRGPVPQPTEVSVGPSRLLGVDADEIHPLANTSGGDLGTVHVYAPPLMELTVYSTHSSRTEYRALRYTLHDDLG